ncbi:MAG: sporulation integral membrane protein YtvI [Clostridia bacterium]|nr:sporulation integral membrane protein YtvI [Clostridia bacterium]
MKNDGYGKYIKYTFIAGCIALLVYFSPTLLNLFLPFILAFIVAAPFHKVVEKLSSKLHINKGISSFVILALIVAIIGGLLFWLIYYLYTQFRGLIDILPDIIESVQDTFMDYYEKYRKYMPGVAEFVDNYIENSDFSINKYTPTITNSAIGYATSFASTLPSALFFIIIFMLSLFFFIKDYNAVINFIKEALPDKTVTKLRYLKNTAWRGFVGYMKSQTILSSITALLVAVTFWFLDIDYAIVWAIIIGIVDALPILGSGIVLIPYAIISFMMSKNLFFSICIIVLQTVVFLVRQMLSPRVMSSQLGIHPLITLISIYVGNELMGVLGMVVFPILALLLVSLYTSYKNAGSLEKAIENANKKD